MLAPAWGYVDQPPLTPWLARTFTSLVADEAWAVRIPATLASAASVVLLGLITRELGVTGGRWPSRRGAGRSPGSAGPRSRAADLDDRPTADPGRGADRAAGAAHQPTLVARRGGGGGGGDLEPAARAAAVVRGRAGLAAARPARAAAHPLAMAGRPRGRGGGGAEPRLPVVQRLAPAGDGRGTVGVQRRRRAGRPAPHPRYRIGPPLVVVWLAGIRAGVAAPAARWLLVPAAALLVFTVVSAAQPHYPLAMLARCTPSGACRSRAGSANTPGVGRWWSG